MLNSCIIMGRLGRTPELRHTRSGTAVANFSVAVDRDFKDKNTGERATDWIPVVARNSAGEFAARYLRKGRLAVVEGRLQMREWTDKGGNKRTTAEAVAEHIYFADAKRDGDSANTSDGYQGNGYGAPPSEDQFSEL